MFGECENFNVLEGHKNAVLDLQWNLSGSKIVTASADKTVGLFDANRGQRTKKYTGHKGVVNSISISCGRTPLAVSGSDDCKAMVWDLRAKSCVQEFESNFAITSACFSADDELVFTAGIDNVVKAWDRRTEAIVFTMEGHTGTSARHPLRSPPNTRERSPCDAGSVCVCADTVTGMSLSPDGSSLLTNSMDKSLIIWDVRPFVNGSRFSKQFDGVQHNMEKSLLKCSWSPDGEKISCGSSDHVVHIWDVPTTEELYHLPGHAGSVNEVAFHPTEPIIGSCGSDKQIYLGEI